MSSAPIDRFGASCAFDILGPARHDYERTVCLGRVLAEFVAGLGPAVHRGVTMSVHGGYMGRSLSRFSVLVGSAIAAGSLLAGCATQIPGPAVIAVPAGATVAQAAPAGDFLAGLEQAVASELSAINSTQTDNEPPEVLVELDALSSESSLIEAENFGKLVTTGANQIAKRERLVNALIENVKNSAYLSGVEVNGTALSTSILALLDGVATQLQTQATALEAAAAPDQLRAVITVIGPSTRVLGLVQPIVHLALAAGAELNAASILEGEYGHLLTRANLFEKGQWKVLYATELQYLGYLKTEIATATSTATADVKAVLTLTPAGYPGNKAAIVSIRAQLLQLKAPLGPLTSGVGNVNYLENLQQQLPIS
jgi:hypothetical protein